MNNKKSCLNCEYAEDEKSGEDIICSLLNKSIEWYWWKIILPKDCPKYNKKSKGELNDRFN